MESRSSILFEGNSLRLGDFMFLYVNENFWCCLFYVLVNIEVENIVFIKYKLLGGCNILYCWRFNFWKVLYVSYVERVFSLLKLVFMYFCFLILICVFMYE